jgi:membrane fusion protein (multidrug efflux system)
MATDIGDTNEMSTEETEVPKRSKRNIVLPIVGVLVLIGLFFGGKYWLYLRAHESTDDAQVAGDIVPVLARVGGYVRTVDVKENDTVQAGQVLVVLDATDLQAKVTQAEADLSAARAAAGGQASAQVSGASSQAQAYGAQLQAARANLEKARSDLARMKELAGKQIVSKQQLDAAQAAYETAQATVTSFQQQQAAATAGTQGARAGADVAQARLQAAQAMLDAAKLQLSYATITAPAGGVVAKKSVNVGQLVQPGQSLFTVVSDTSVWVTANFKETQLRDIRPGQLVEVDVDAYPGCPAKGVVESIGAATGSQFALLPADNASGNFTKVVQRIPVRIGVKTACGADRPLRPGMSVTAHVDTK